MAAFVAPARCVLDLSKSNADATANDQSDKQLKHVYQFGSHIFFSSYLQAAREMRSLVRPRSVMNGCELFGVGRFRALVRHHAAVAQDTHLGNVETLDLRFLADTIADNRLHDLISDEGQDSERDEAGH